ncbi:hypothetical protein EGT74_17290 [Chitinophaga lutea]|uniref:PKD domain-containing protein n=1 Tax=Chitinophaga lutea TaxID=2488634 RepID=A0A3N4PLW5_9BACT|nr:PKD domain-containing protein [Chitinophaga lutea]RPE08785.1 hypothetical protein EGT74_17290 [Chitinophaga lutea]
MMKKIYYPVLFLAMCASIVACKKDEPVEIVSLSKPGQEFYYGEKVPVWAATSGDLHDVTYSWTATGGTFDGWRTQNLFENLWIAPVTPGEYTITATAKNGKNTSSRSTVMKVVRYFFDEFQDAFTTAGGGWAESNINRTLVANTDPKKSIMEFDAKDTNIPTFRRPLNVVPLKIPFSVSAEFGWKKSFRANEPITFSMIFEQPEANPSFPYLREIRWEIYPTVGGTGNNYRIRFSTAVPQIGGSEQFSENGNTAATLPKPLPLLNPVTGRLPAFAMASGAEQKITFSVDANHVFHAYVGGQLWFTSTGIKDWLAYAKATYAGFQDPVAKEFRLTIPAKQNTNATSSTVFLNSVYIVNDGSILK